jgi:hypothetical protein
MDLLSSSPETKSPHPWLIDGTNQDVEQMEVKDNIEESSEQVSDHIKPEKWNSSKINAFRYLETLLAFLIMGANDASVGVSLVMQCLILLLIQS